MTPALDVRGLTHRFGQRTALSDVSFGVAPGAFTVLLGPNGAGKTTLFALITRLYHAHQGRIAVFGQDFKANPSAALSRIGVVFQQPTLDLDLTVEQNLRYHAALHGMSGRDAAPRIADELARVNLADRAGERVRWSTSRRCCCWTSRRRAWTWKAAASWPSTSAASAPSGISPCCGRPI